MLECTATTIAKGQGRHARLNPVATPNSQYSNIKKSACHPAQGQQGGQTPEYPDAGHTLPGSKMTQGTPTLSTPYSHSSPVGHASMASK